MALPDDLPVVDHHCHLSPSGEGVEAARRFQKAGGTHLFLATQSYGTGAPTTVDGYESQFETTAQLADRIRAEVGTKVYIVIAPYPVDLVAQVPALGAASAVRLHEDTLRLCGRWVEEQRAVAIGEVGRPHFETPPDLRELSERVFDFALDVARDAGCPVVVHSEDLDVVGYRALAERAARASFPLSRVIKHYQRSLHPPGGTAGLVPSYLARRDLADQTLRSEGPWFWETDFLDDPKRPGAVLDLATVPRRASRIAAQSPELLERLRIPFIESVRTVYGFEPVVERREGR